MPQYFGDRKNPISSCLSFFLCSLQKRTLRLRRVTRSNWWSAMTVSTHLCKLIFLYLALLYFAQCCLQRPRLLGLGLRFQNSKFYFIQFALDTQSRCPTPTSPLGVKAGLTVSLVSDVTFSIFLFLMLAAYSQNRHIFPFLFSLHFFFYIIHSIG